MGSNDEWSEYHQKFKGAPPRPLLLRALEHIGDRSEQVPPPLAVDLGCGAGQDSLELLGRGWRVVAVDASAGAGEIIRSALPAEARSRFEFRQARFEDAELPGGATLIYAAVSLPFCAQEAFPDLWSKIKAALVPGGWFAGNFFGPEDDWVRNGRCIGHAESDLAELFRDFRVLSQLQERKRGMPVVGPEKHWHIFDVIATLEQ